MATPLYTEMEGITDAIATLTDRLSNAQIFIEIRHDFNYYVDIRCAHGDIHLNQAFNPDFVCFSKDDFWLLARERSGAAIATYCVRRFNVEDFYSLIRSQMLWFSRTPHRAHRMLNVECAIPPFGGEITHGGGLWVREDVRGTSRLASILPRLARALSYRQRLFDHDTGMIRNLPKDSTQAAERKAVFAGIRIYGFARVKGFANGWFPPEDRNAIMHLCHATRSEAVASVLNQLPRNVSALQCQGANRTTLEPQPIVE
jgi:hypothetical protein